MTPLVVLAGLASLVLGCKDRKQPIVEAKAKNAATLAEISAYYPLVKPQPTTLAGARIADVARKRIAQATHGASVRKAAQSVSVEQEIEDPSLGILGGLDHVHFMCDSTQLPSEVPSTEKLIENLDQCAKAIELLEGDLARIHESAVAEGIGEAFPAGLSAWATEDSKKEAAALEQIRKDEDDFDAKWTRPTATFEELDALCKAAIDKVKDVAPGAAEAPSDTELRDLQSRRIVRCVALVSYRLADRLFGKCLDRNDGACFHEGACGLVRGLRDELEPKFGLSASTYDPDAVPAALRPRAKAIVDRCNPYFL